jgi:hypothetical protein
MTTHDSFLDVLAARGRSPDIAIADDVYGWLIGSWELDVLVHDDHGNTREGKGEVHFSWVLEGRAVQDVWISPRRVDRGPGRPQGMYGTTFRVYGPSIHAWRITWLNPVNGDRDELIGRWQGKDIVQDGKSAEGTTIRWSFTDITPESFRWLGETAGFRRHDLAAPGRFPRAPAEVIGVRR